MPAYYVNTNAQANGDHEVHQSGCTYMPGSLNSVYLGDFTTCADAIREAKKHFARADGCQYCCPECHTS